MGHADGGVPRHPEARTALVHGNGGVFSSEATAILSTASPAEVRS
ncbi:hypothetical protein ACH347_26835 [Saccharopolyspora sp. 5N102]